MRAIEYETVGRRLDRQRRHPSPLRYPGGKGKIANYLKLLFVENGLVGHDYVELYAGGASAALSLLFEEYAARIHINDINRGMYAFWDATLKRTDEIARRISSVRLNMAEWQRQRAVQAARQPDPLDLALSTFYLNRTSRSGIIGGGVIGGNRQTGEWGIDARFNKTELIRRIEKIARFGSRIVLSRIDAAVYLRRHVQELRPESFLYLDPPYYVKGAQLYERFYRPRNHTEIANLVRTLTHPWVVSYDRVPPVTKLYAQFERIAYSLSYSAADRYQGGEVMFFSHGLRRPRVKSPAGISMGTVEAAVARTCRASA